MFLGTEAYSGAVVWNHVSSLSPSAVDDATGTNCSWLLGGPCDFLASAENKYKLCGGMFFVL
jgi:hypothetical protein